MLEQGHIRMALVIPEGFGSRMSGGLREIVMSRSGLLSSSKRFAELILAQYDVTYAPGGGEPRSRLSVGVKGSGLRVLAPSWVSR